MSETKTRSAGDVLDQRITKFTFDIMRRDHRRLKRVAIEQDKHMRDLINEAIREYVFKKYDPTFQPEKEKEES